ncbi:hypothetical protein [Cryptosporangium sp. NPDC051539]|uniref:hypothetical protein n=1 Tax=Cryptosporangium sp. NPDC051539 TaxID=3363962 RepID=UPI003799E8E1
MRLRTGVDLLMAQFFQSAQGLDALSAGVRMIAWGATTVFVPRLAGKLIPAHGAAIFLVVGMTLHGAVFAVAAGAAGSGLLTFAGRRPVRPEPGV